MELDAKKLKSLSDICGETFYILDTKRFTDNFNNLRDAFRAVYPNSNIAYSYKTNYIPRLCKIVDELGGYAEVVSDMEYELALRVGVAPEKIMFNGPYKRAQAVEKLLLSGGTVNLDNVEELKVIEDIINRNADATLHLGVRCNFVIGDGVVSRFGFDIESEDFKTVMEFIASHKQTVLTGIHCHFASRALDFWPARADGALSLYGKYADGECKHIDLGGGIYGSMDESLKAQFSAYIPDFCEYADAAATKFAEYFTGDNKPTLFIEPGTALAGDAMLFAARVKSIKQVGDKSIATLLGSMYNINPTLNKKNPPLRIYAMGGEQKEYTDLDFGGFTCIESDYLYRGYNGALAVGDYAVFENIGSYSVVLKPPFILPQFAVIDPEESGERMIVKRPECFDDIFHTYNF